MADSFQFGFNPFVVADRSWSGLPMEDYLGNRIGPTSERVWELSPELAAQNPDLFNNWTTRGNFGLMPYVEGMDPQFRVKTGDKEGTLYTLKKGEGGYSAAPESTMHWDTNDQLKNWGPLIPLAAMGAAYGASQAFPSLFGGAAGGATEPVASLSLGGAAGGATEPVSSLALGGAGSAAGGATEPVASLALGGAGTAASAGSGLLKSLSDLTGISESVLKTLIPVAGGALSYFDAKRNDGKVQGYQPSIDVLTANAQRQWQPPQFSTSIPPPPQFSTGLIPDMNFARPRLGLIG
jgi:hypothetical protein